DDFLLGRLPIVVGDLFRASSAKEKDYLFGIATTTWRHGVDEDSPEEKEHASNAIPSKKRVRRRKAEQARNGSERQTSNWPSVKAFELLAFVQMLVKGHPAAVDVLLLPQHAHQHVTLFATS